MAFIFPKYLFLQHTILNSALIEEEYQELGLEYIC